MTILGTTKVSKGGKITLIEAAREVLQTKEGDIIVFEHRDNREIVIKKG